VHLSVARNTGNSWKRRQIKTLRLCSGRCY